MIGLKHLSSKCESMKWIIIQFLLFGCIFLQAQEVHIQDSVFLCFVNPEKSPKWTQGTNQELIQNLKTKISYPKDQCISGITVMHFRVDTFGQVLDPKIVRSISKNIDTQLIKLIVDFTFIPGKFFDKKVDFNMTLPIRLDLE